jgi:succinate dehydrogenase hydrophobic anchor subunit
MDTLLSIAPVILLALSVGVVYFRFRDTFSDLAAATDSTKSSGFWSIATLLYAIAIALLYATFHVGHSLWISR